MLSFDTWRNHVQTKSPNTNTYLWTMIFGSPTGAKIEDKHQGIADQVERLSIHDIRDMYVTPAFCHDFAYLNPSPISIL